MALLLGDGAYLISSSWRFPAAADFALAAAEHAPPVRAPPQSRETAASEVHRLRTHSVSARSDGKAEMKTDSRSGRVSFRFNRLKRPEVYPGSYW
jgi:hypothetical protein